MTSPVTPPVWPLKVLRLFVKEEYLEEIEGDMEEVFRDNVESVSISHARRIYIWETFKLLRPILMKNMEGMEKLNQYGMLKNYFKVAIRGLMKNPLNSTINIIGLAIAIGFWIYGYGFARWTYSTDQFHKNKDAVFLTTFFANREGALQQYGTTPRPLGEQLKQDFAQIKKVCRVEDRSVVVKYGDHIFNERVRYTDPEFLEMFTFPMKWGVSGTLADINSVILSEKMSIKYFGEENPIGQTLHIRFDKDHSKEFKITGVASKFPNSITIAFSFLINIENLRASEPAYDFHDWSAFVNATFIQVGDPVDIASIEPGMAKYRGLQNEAAREEWAISSFAFEPLATLHERAGNIRDDISRSSDSNYVSVLFMVGIAFTLLALACFNYINIAIVSAARRLKEIGVRKSIGATRGIVIAQFLTENLVIAFVALAVGLVLGSMVFIPWFESLWDFRMGFTLNDRYLWIFLTTVLFITGIASGIYPAFYISRFQVVGILKGSVKFGSSNPLTRVFLCIQLIMACLFISGSVVFTQNADFLAHRSWGYDNREAIYAVVPDELAFEQLNALMSREPGVLSISGSRDHVGKRSTAAVAHFPDREYEVDQLAVDANYLQTLGIPLKSGRVFNDHEGSDHQAVIVNEAFAKNLGWENAIGKQFRMDSTQYDVIGVTRNFHSTYFSKAIRPTVFTVGNKKEYRYLTMKVKAGSEVETYKTLLAKWAQLYPEIPFNGGYQEDVWGAYYTEIGIYGHVWRVFATLAILLASLGLYGLVTLNVSGRVKEFSIRKVLGAKATNIAGNILGQYFMLFAIALAIGAPLSYIGTKALMDFSSAVHVEVTFWSVAFSMLILVVVLLVTVSTQVRKVLKSNPVEGLKVE